MVVKLNGNKLPLVAIYGKVSVPLRGNGRETVQQIPILLQVLDPFPSPCGVMVVNPPEDGDKGVEEWGFRPLAG